MLLAVDIGNTSTHFGVFDKEKLIKDWRVATEEVQDCKIAYSVERIAYSEKLNAIRYPLNANHYTLKKYRASNIIICSVVPRALISLRQNLKKTFNCSPIVVGEDVKVPLKNLYKSPGQVGQDRLVGAYAAYKKYGGPVIIVDFGTAITIDVVSREGEYLGGVIVPGVDISLDALSKRTALLPKVKLTKPSQLIATDTKNSIISGITYGFASLCDGLIERFRISLRRKDVAVVTTGGYTNFIAPYSDKINDIEPHLVLSGLQLLALAQIEC